MKGLFYATSMVAMAAVITSCGNGGAKKAAADSTAMAADSNVVVLFDGTSLDGWRGYNKDTVPSAWTLEDGCIKINGSGAGEAGARNGGDLMLCTTGNDYNNVTVLTNSSKQAMRTSAKNILYTVVNSRAYEAENLNPGMAKWKVILIGADVVAALLIVGLEYTAIKNYKKRKEEEEEV